MGAENQHLKFLLYIPGTTKLIDAVYFNKAEQFKEDLQKYYGENYENYINAPKDLYVDILFEPDINEYKGQKNLQLRLKDLKIVKRLSLNN